MRRIRVFLVGMLVLLLATVAEAQTKISGTGHCNKPYTQSTVQVGDRANHFFVVSQGKCTWVKPWEIEGIQSKEGSITDFAEIIGNASSYRGYYLDTMANGDNVHYSYGGTTTLKDGVPLSAEHKWSIIRGTGKLTGIKGQGICKGRFGEDGSMTWQCEGEYELPK